MIHIFIYMDTSMKYLHNPINTNVIENYVYAN